MIYLDESQAGSGKTTRNCETIAQNPQQYYLIIVPSVALAEEYVVNTGGTSIHSENKTGSSVGKDISRLMHTTRILIITQQSFKLFENKDDLCRGRDVFQDEELAIVESMQINIANHKQWADIFNVMETIHNGIYTVTLNDHRLKEFQETLDILDNKDVLKTFTSTGNLLVTNTPDIDGATVYKMASPDIYKTAKSVTISCANFKSTVQYNLWNHTFEVEFMVINPFVKYITPNLQFHHAEQARNSKSYNTIHTHIHDSFVKYVKEQTSNAIYLDNKMFDDITEEGWTRLQQNCQGVNSFRDHTHIAIASAVNYNTYLSNILMKLCNMDALQIRASLIGEITHQLIMRGILRVNINSICHVYLMEKDLCDYLLTHLYETPLAAKVIPDTLRTIRVLKEVVKPSDRNKASMMRKMQPSVTDGFSDRELMTMAVWFATKHDGTPKVKKQKVGV
jgi:hypothetical protein